MSKNYITCDGNTAAARIAYAFSEVAVIYPITPSSPMGELADSWSAQKRKNIFGQPLKVIEMQSEAGAAGAIHGSLTGGALTTTFTASQGLLLMMPNMFKIAGELLPAVFHVASRSLAAQALSIFGDHSDTMAVRSTGFGLLASGSVQEVQDLAIVAHLTSLSTRIPFVHFFDGFRTSHEIQKIETIDDDALKQMVDMKWVEDFRAGALDPNKPYAKVGAQNPDVYFQGRESVNRFYDAVPSAVKAAMQKVYDATGRKYDLFEYIGASDATKILISMGSSVETIDETIEYLTKKGEKVGALKVRLYRPFSAIDFIDKIPESVEKIAVLDRTKEPGSIGEPLYLDVLAALKQHNREGIQVIGGRYGLSSKEFTPNMIKGIFNHLDINGSDNKTCGHHNFTVGIIDDVTNLSINYPDDESSEHVLSEKEGTIRCKFWGYGSDGTVSANKNAIKIIGEGTSMSVQGYFEYDSKKSGGVTVSHLRFGKEPIKSQYLVNHADFIALHKHSYIGRYDILDGIVEGGTFLINSPWEPEHVFSNLTADMQRIIREKNVKVYTVNASKIARDAGLGSKINTVMQTAFFKLSKVLPEDQAIDMMKQFIKKQFERKGMDVVEMNWKAVDSSRDAVQEVIIPDSSLDVNCAPEVHFIPDYAPAFAKNIIEPIMRKKGDTIPVSAMTINGAVPTGTTKLEPRGVAESVPLWLPEHCIQCGQCSFVCPHAAIRVKQIDPKTLEEEKAKGNVPESFKTLTSNTKNSKGLLFRVQVYPEFCTGCGVCVQACPTKDKSLVMESLQQARDKGENKNQAFFDTMPNIIEGIPEYTIKGTQMKEKYLEFSGACSGCGETPYVSLLTSMFGNHMLIANATGCSSIWGGTFPTIPYTKNKDGKGPAWANSLFEDNAEYGYGMRLAVDSNRDQLKSNIEKVLQTGTTDNLKAAFEEMLSVWNEKDRTKAEPVAEKVLATLPDALSKVYGESTEPLKKIDELKDYLCDKSVWIVGGDGWAYDIGFGGLDHVLASGKNVKVLVLDTEVYSNTGGQASKSTPRGATAKFAAAGKTTPKKNLGMMMMSYGNVYVASVDLGANKQQVINALKEAEEYDGPAIIIGYAACINHGLNMTYCNQHGADAVKSGYWPLYRYNPEASEHKLKMDSPAESSIDFKEYIMEETRYKALDLQDHETATKLFGLAEEDAKLRQKLFKEMSER